MRAARDIRDSAGGQPRRARSYSRSTRASTAEAAKARARSRAQAPSAARSAPSAISRSSGAVKRGDVARGDQQAAVLVSDDVRQAAVRCRDHRAPERLCLQRGEPEGLGQQGREDDDRAPAHRRDDVGVGPRPRTKTPVGGVASRSDSDRPMNTSGGGASSRAYASISRSAPLSRVASPATVGTRQTAGSARPARPLAEELVGDEVRHHLARLREVCNADQGGEVHNVSGELHPDHVRIALAAAAATGPVLCGVDLIVRGVKAPGGAVINEVNTTPALYVVNEAAPWRSVGRRPHASRLTMDSRGIRPPRAWTGGHGESQAAGRRTEALRSPGYKPLPSARSSVQR